MFDLAGIRFLLFAANDPIHASQYSLLEFVAFGAVTDTKSLDDALSRFLNWLFWNIVKNKRNAIFLAFVHD